VALVQRTASERILEARKRYVEAFGRSDFEAMLNYYKRNYPREPYQEDPSPVVKVKAPVLMIHGLADTALLAGALNNTWEWLEKARAISVQYCQRNSSGSACRYTRISITLRAMRSRSRTPGIRLGNSVKQ